MKEVSCRVFEIFFSPLEKKHVPTSKLVEGTELSLDVLRSKSERIDWAEFVTVLRNIGAVFDESELVEIGRMHLRSPMTRFASVIARLLFSPMEFYAWLYKPSNGLGKQLFTCIEPSYRQLSPTEIVVSLSLPEGFELAWEFFVVSKGNFTEMPRLLGYPEAKVTLERAPSGATYHIVVPQGASLLTKLRRVLLWPFTARSAAKELKEAHEALRDRFVELEGAQDKLDEQATQLRTAHAVSALVHRDLDLDRTLDAIARALVEEAGFDHAGVHLDVEVDGVHVLREVEHGERTASGGVQLVRALNARGGQTMGELRVSSRAAADRIARDELLAFVGPTISMAVDNAVSYLVVEQYRKGLEKRVDERTAEVSRARDELAATVLHLQQAREVRERIFANVNHELRTPLTLILLAVGDARERLSAAADRASSNALVTIEHGARRLLRMVDDLLLLAEGREADIELHLTPCDLADATARVVDAWRRAARSSGVDLELETSGPCIVRADRDAIERVVTNLLSHAMKLTPKGGRIDLRVIARDGRAWLEMPEGGAGTGIDGNIGLSLVKELVRAHAGTIDVESLPDVGTMLRIGLPLASHDAPAAVNRPRASLRPEDFGLVTHAAPTRESYAPKGPAMATILLAEDDAELRDRIARLLAVDYRVIAASDGIEGLRLAEMHRPDLLVTDLSMPGIDGIELTKRFRALAGSRVAPVLLLTASGGIGDRLSGFEAGAIDYILKPFEPAELRARIRSQLALRGLALQLLETEKLAALGSLSAGLAHEMRNPANGIVNAIEPLRAVLPKGAIMPGSDAAELLDVIAKSSEQIGNLARQLLGFRRGAAIEKQTIPLDGLLKRVRSNVQPVLAGVELRERLEYRGPVTCAEALIAQVLTSLLDNAAHAAGRGGWIEVRSRKGDDRVIVELEDSGPGVPNELRERIFEPFFTTKPPGEGSGLGLSTAREIVMQHGGTLGIADGAGRTVFRVELPVGGASLNSSGQSAIPHAG